MIIFLVARLIAAKRTHRVAHELDGLGEKCHLEAALFGLFHHIGHLAHIGKLAVTQCVAHSCFAMYTHSFIERFELADTAVNY